MQNYTHPLLDDYTTQYFNASLKAQQYASGGVDQASKGWIIILALVFLMNVFVFVYFLFHRHLVTDFSEPPNLFALAVNSPPSHLLAGSCGGGPEGKQYTVNWIVNHEGSHLFMEPGEKTHLLEGHGNAHMHTHATDGGGGPGPTASGFIATVIEAIRRGLGLKEHRAPTKLRQASAVENLRAADARLASVAGSDYEMGEGHTRTERQYTKLANRRSML